MPLDALDAWRLALAPAFRPAMRVVDVGAGTGLFADAFARWFGAGVIAVEPSEGMRRSAMSAHPHPLVACVAGTAECLPLAAATCDVAWLSTVIHHIADLPACAAELRRVLRDAACPVFIRSIFPGYQDGVTLLRLIPAAARIAGTFPTIEATVAAFASAGFALRLSRTVEQVSAPDMRVFAERVRSRADTTLKLITDDEYEAGVAAVDALAGAETAPSPVVDHLVLLELRREA
jgi:SAM-dependent methyltransferase